MDRVKVLCLEVTIDHPVATQGIQHHPLVSPRYQRVANVGSQRDGEMALARCLAVAPDGEPGPGDHRP